MSRMEKFRQLFKKSVTVPRGKGALALALAVVLMVLPFAARGQLGLDPCCAIIAAGLDSISGLLNSVVGKPLGVIQQLEQDAANFEQQVVYPIKAIDNARALAGQMQAQLREMTQLYQLPTGSATLPGPQQLEQALLSHNPQALTQITQNYAAVYGQIIAPGDAQQDMRDFVDMTDAEAQAALKKALELDAIADVELAAADQINQQIQSAAPGSAPILEAQTGAWLVRANAYSQSAMAELMRVHSIDLAGSSAQLKFSAAQTKALRTSTGQILAR